MTRTPEERLRRLARHARKGFSHISSDPEARRRASLWLSEHPSPMPDVDRAWQECLSGRGPLAQWLGTDADFAAWHDPLPLHTLLASHPFTDISLWLIPETSGAS